MAETILKELTYNGYKVVVEVAKRDQKGNVIDTTYATKAELPEDTTYTLDTTTNNVVQLKDNNGNVQSKTINNVANATKASSADNATKATQDGSGNVITSTYATKSSALASVYVDTDGKIKGKYVSGTTWSGDSTALTTLSVFNTYIGTTAPETYAALSGSNIFASDNQFVGTVTLHKGANLPYGPGWLYWRNQDDTDNDYALYRNVFYDYTAGSTNIKRITFPSKTGTLALTDDIPSSLKTQYKISFKDKSNNTVSFDGSSAVDLTSGVYYAVSSGSATKANQDANGNVITDTYAKKTSLATVATSGSYNDLSNKPTIGTGTLTLTAGSNTATFSANATSNVSFTITASDLGLSSAMKFGGTSKQTLSEGGTQNADATSGNYTASTQPANGTVYLDKGQHLEYVWVGGSGTTTLGKWELLGQDGSYALSTTKITGTGALSGGGTLAGDRAITHTAGSAPNKSTGLYKFSTDAYSHVNAVTAVTKADITALGIPGSDTNTTYTLTGTNDTLTYTPSDGDAQTITVNNVANATNAKYTEMIGDASLHYSFNSLAANFESLNHHTHPLSIATSTSTSSITLQPSTKYVLTAGGSTYVFTTPKDTQYENATTRVAGLMSTTDKEKLDSFTLTDFTIAASI